MKKITILIPCHNEEKAICKVIDSIPHEKLRMLGFFAEVVVIDNNSSDRTAEIAIERNVIVISEEKKGKGNAMKAGFNAVSPNTDYVVMLDGDNTYCPDEIPRIIEPLDSNFCDVVIGSRLSGKIRKGSFKFSNRVANWFYTFITRQIYRANTTDVLSGYFGWKKEVIDDIKDSIKAGGFVLEIEMIIKMVRLGYEIYAVP